MIEPSLVLFVNRWGGGGPVSALPFPLGLSGAAASHPGNFLTLIIAANGLARILTRPQPNLVKRWWVMFVSPETDGGGHVRRA